MHTIKKIININPFKLTLEFEDLSIRVVNLEEKFKEWSKTPESKFRELLDPNQFRKAKLNKEFQSIYWDNGIDLCPDVLFELSKSEITIAST